MNNEDVFSGGITYSHGVEPVKIPLSPMNKAMLRIEHSKVLDSSGKKEIAYYMVNQILIRIST